VLDSRLRGNDAGGALAPLTTHHAGYRHPPRKRGSRLTPRAPTGHAPLPPAGGRVIPLLPAPQSHAIPMPLVRLTPRGAHRTLTDVRPAGVHPLLEPLAARNLGREAADGPERIHTSDPCDRPTVPAPSSPTRCGATPDIEPEAARALRVLRDHRKRAVLVAVPPRGGGHLAEVARPAQARRASSVGAIRGFAEAVSASGCGNRPLGVPSAVNP